jgi:GAF domain-containing protein
MDTPAVGVTEALRVLAKLCEGAADDRKWVQIAITCARLFGVTEQEIAILQAHGEALRFIVPEKLRAVGTIPLTASTTSIAARTAVNKKPELQNQVANTRHASVFEAVKLDPKAPSKGPIQKLMSVPIMKDQECLGVIQVSRKGPADTGIPDFTSRDLNVLSDAARQLARLLQPPAGA